MKNFQNGKFNISGESVIENLELLTIALDASISGIIITDNLQQDNPIVYCNKAFELITGYSRAQIIGHNCRFLQGDDRAQIERDVLKRAVRDGKECKVEIRNYRKNGELFWNELYMSPIKDATGSVTHFIGVQNDVTLRKKAEQDLRQQKSMMEKKVEERTAELRESESFLSSIIETVREGLLVLDPKFYVLSANHHFLSTFKVSAEETVGRHLYELGNHQWDIPVLKELLIKILPTNNPVVDFEVEHDFPHIGKKLMLLNAYRIELEGQFKDQILLAIEDITERKEIERRKDDFLSIASHELKTPLTTIKGYIQILERHIPDNASEKFNKTLGKVASYVDRLNNLIAELLDVSRIQTGNIELHKTSFDFDAMIDEAIEGIRALATNHRILINGRTGAQVIGDESHIIQVINNLLSNAIKYAPDAQEIEVSISKVSDYIKVSVRDFGLGMNSEDKKRVFERFFRSGEIQKRFPGMGIGLYICDQIIKNHGGTLWVESEIGKGSTFSFTIPNNQE
ncbi:MAG: PAS domain-containing protein [Pedobacter sp.]|uniref:PAS domain-containing sensor histidine kinase n=1 Tax=Pedobacter sp. TaxID=1411316 RepID=UPI003394E8D7